MKLITMHVDDFGGLHNYDYNFEEGLNVVLHDNGWGKTTMAAFLKAMLYGYDTKRSKDITENERKRYLPWQGGKYGGSLDFEAEGVRYRIYRTFGETPRFDTTKIVNLDTKTKARIPTNKIGETLFHLDASAFQRSVFINQNGLSINGAASSIHTRLNALVSQANDVSAYDGAISSLTQEIKVYEKTGARGQLGDIARQINKLEQIRDQLERDISKQDAARERISELDILLNSINKDLDEKNKRLDEVSGEEKKREAAKKLLADIDDQITTLQEQINTIKEDLGGSVPTQTEIDQVKRQTQTMTSLKVRIGELEASQTELTKKYNELLEEYDGTLPTSAQLDRIQSIYGEMQGLRSSDEMVFPTEVPEEYLTIKAVADADPEYIDRLQSSIGMQMTFQSLIRKLDSADRDLKSDANSWEEKTKRYTELKTEVERLQKEAKDQEAYDPSKVEPIISNLEDLQKRQQTVTVKKEALSSDFLTPEQENLLKEISGELPDVSEGREILNKYRNVARTRAEIQGLTARLDGEKSKAESLFASIAQLDAVKALDTSAPEEPRKSSGNVLIGTGAAVAVLGVILGILVQPALFAVVAVGVVLAIFGIVSNNNYKQKVQAYNVWKSASEQNQESVRKKEDLLAQKSIVQASVDSLEQQIADHQKELQADDADVSAWFDKWGNNGEDRTETAISHILENAEEIEKLRKKQVETAALRVFVDDETAAIESARADIDAAYPECSGKPIPEALSFLRGKMNEFRMTERQWQTAVKKEEQFVNESGVAREAFEQAQSPKAAELTTARAAAAAELQSKLISVNKDLAPLGLDTDQEHIAQALREAEEMLNEYKRYADKVKDQASRQRQKRQQEEELQKRLSEALIPISSRCSEKEVPERLTIIREEIGRANQLRVKISDSEAELERQRRNLVNADKAVHAFKNSFGRFSSNQEDILPEIYDKAGKYAELLAAKKQLENQRATVGKDNQSTSGAPANEEETLLRAEVGRLKKRRDNLLIEYTQKGEFIRQADQSLEKYPDTVQEIHTLYEQKQKAQNNLATLKRAIQLITQAKENLANRYLSKVEDLFNSYMHIWLNNDAVKGLLDVDFNITIEENGKAHVAEGYSTGYCDLIDFCMRLALVDTLFENEQPFLILDDPFVNLDADRLEKALELLNIMAANKQIVYFVCHPIRAVETEENTASRAEFLKLAEATKKTIAKHQAGASTRKKIVRKSPKEMYKTVGSSEGIPFKPAKPDYTITNNIFSMNFVPDGLGVPKDSSYELFFIDAVGHVLNDRQIIEINNGKLSTERVQFSLNTRDDSGNEFELMVRESGQDDYEVSARFPFKAKLAFAGTFSFDF